LSLPALPVSLSAAAPRRSVSLPAVPLIVAAPTVAVAMRSAKHASEAMIVERLFTFMAEPHFLRRPTHGRRVAIATPTMREPAQETLKTVGCGRRCVRVCVVARRAAPSRAGFHRRTQPASGCNLRHRMEMSKQAAIRPLARVNYLLEDDSCTARCTRVAGPVDRTDAVLVDSGHGCA